MYNKICGVYGIFDAISDECLYIGQSKDIAYRQKTHLKLLKNRTHKRKDFVEWYNNQLLGDGCLIFRTLEECDADDEVLNAIEIKWFKYYNPRYYGSVPSVRSTWGHSDATKQKISKSVAETLKSKRPSDEINRIERDLYCQECKSLFHSRSVSPLYCSKACLLESKASALSEMEEEVCSSYLNGLSLRQCAALFGVSYVTVRRILINNSVERRKK